MAVFGGLQRERVCADNGADGKIMKKASLLCIESAVSQVDVDTLGQPRIFDLAAATREGTKATLVCTKEALVDVEIHIRLGTALRLQNVEWLLTSQHVNDPLLGRPIVEDLGLNMRDLLASEADRFAGSVDVDSIVGSFIAQGDGRHAGVMEGVFHGDGGIRLEEDIVSTDECCGIGIETKEE